MADSVELGTNRQLSTRELSDWKQYCQDNVQSEDNWETYICKTCGKPKGVFDVAENVGTSWVSETRAVSAVFSIDLVLEEIFSTMAREDLVNCRFVCRRWSVLASKALQKFHAITFCQLKETSEFIGWGNPLRPLQHLMYHMNNSLSPKSHFPCTSFVFTFARLDDAPPQLFFKDFGPYITKLKLVQAEFNSHGPIVIDDMETHVISQMPNLKQLELSGSVAFKSDEKQVGAVGSKSHLRYLEFADIIHENIFEDIFNRSSKLNQVQLHIMKNRQYHVRRDISSHLLRKITMRINDICELAHLEHLVNNKRCQTWNLQEVHLNFSNLKGSPSTSSRVVNVFNNILSLCSPSCKKLVWHSFDFEGAGLQILPMPNVTHLKLNHTCSKPFFPKGYFLETILPNLTDIVFGDKSEFGGEEILITDLFPKTKPALSVKRVSLILRLWEEESLRPSFKKMFPNSKFTLRK